MFSLNDFAILFGISLSLISLTITYLNFRHIYKRLAVTIIGSYFLIVLWAVDLYFINTLPNFTVAHQLSVISTLLLSSSLYLLQNFYDELSASYRQRKTMTLGSLLYGLVLGSIWVPDFVILSDNREILTDPIVASLILSQAALTTYRIIRHFLHQASLSEYYGIPSVINNKKIRYVQLFFGAILFLGLILGVVRPIFGWHTGLSDPFMLIDPLGYLLLAVLSYYDPISSLPVAQKIKVAALIDFSAPEKRLEYIFSSTLSSSPNDLNDFIYDIQSLIQELIRSSSSVRSIATQDVFVMFEECGDKLLLLIMEHPSNLIRNLMKRTAAVLNSFQAISTQDFAKIIQSNLIYM